MKAFQKNNKKNNEKNNNSKNLKSRNSRSSNANRLFLFTFIILVLFLFMFLINTSSVKAVGLSVNKASIDYRDVLKGGYAEETIYVASDADFDVPIEYEVLGDIKEWISFRPDNNSNISLYVSKNHMQPLTIIMQPPVDVPAGNYSGGVRIITGSLNRPGGQYGSQLQAAFLININLGVSGQEKMACNVGGLTIRDTEIGSPLEYSMTVYNEGNVRVKPNVTIDLWNQDQTKFLYSKTLAFNNIEILPTTSKTLSESFPHNLRLGQYWGYVTVYPCQKTELVSFDILEKGSIADTGDLLRIENKPWAKTGEIVPVTAVFRNNGQRIVSAKLKGTITLDNKIVEVIDSDYVDVAPQETANILVYFTPKKQGQYAIVGRIFYNNKLSYEKSSYLNVNEGEEITSFNWLYVLILIAIIIIVLVLLINIKRRKHRMHRL